MKTWIRISSSLCFLASLFWSSQVLAIDSYNTQFEEWSPHINYDGSWYMSFGAGGTFPSVKDSYHVVTAPGWPSDHYIQSNIKGAPIIAVGGGYILSRLDQEMLPYLNMGLNFSYDFFAKTNGHIDQYSSPAFNNYNYSYDIHRQTLMAVFKADLVNYYNFMPYIALGLGYSLNKVSGYQEHPLKNVTPRVSPGFNEATNGYFAYTVGAGIDYIACNNIWISLDYYYGDFGRAKTSTADNPATLAGNNFHSDEIQSKLSANTVLVTFTYLQNKV